MKKVMFSTFVAVVLLGGSSFAQGQKASTKQPVKSVAAPVATAQPMEKKETTATPKKETKATEPAKKEATKSK